MRWMNEECGVKLSVKAGPVRASDLARMYSQAVLQPRSEYAKA
jgi:hypothetical protein